MTNPFGPPAEVDPATTAMFDSECAGCYGPIEVGDPIYLIDGEWCCEPCEELL